jgi:hypothetical protein
MFAQTDSTITKTKEVVEEASSTIFDLNSLLTLAVLLSIALVTGAIISYILRKISRFFAHRADKTSDLGTVNRLRRAETWIIISIAIIKVALLVSAFYLWWQVTHEGGPNTNAIIGASALAIVLLGGVLGPLLRDFAFGAGMMAEQWFGVGDVITIDFPNVQGVVERITLRSTKLRGLNGEVIWVANQTMSGVHVAQKGVRRTAVDIFVKNAEDGAKLIDRANLLLPGGVYLLVSPLEVVEVTKKDKDIWHITAIAETAPGREWIIENTAIEVLKKIDEDSKKPVLIVDPVARYADKDSERQFTRAITNARKQYKTFNYRKVASSKIVDQQKTMTK